MKWFQAWWSLTGDKVPFWKVFWLFWFLPTLLFGALLGLFYMAFSWHVFSLPPAQIKHAMDDFRGVVDVCLLPLNFLGLLFVYRARERCRWIYVAIIALIILFAALTQSVLSLLWLLRGI